MTPMFRPVSGTVPVGSRQIFVQLHKMTFLIILTNTRHPRESAEEWSHPITVSSRA